MPKTKILLASLCLLLNLTVAQAADPAEDFDPVADIYSREKIQITTPDVSAAPQATSTDEKNKSKESSIPAIPTADKIPTRTTIPKANDAPANINNASKNILQRQDGELEIETKIPTPQSSQKNTSNATQQQTTLPTFDIETIDYASAKIIQHTNTQQMLDHLPATNQIASFSYADYLKVGDAGKVKMELSQTGPAATTLAITITMLILSFIAYRKNKMQKHNV